MKQLNEMDLRKRWALSRVSAIFVAVVSVAVLHSGCDTLDKPVSSPYYAEVVTPPVKKEFRWSNGRLPRSFDPAMAAAPPESDIVRAIYECLTLTDPKTLEGVPAIAEKWYTPDNGLTWKFGIRKDAVWSNGKPVHADDFIRSWNRLLSLGDKAAHPELLRNFARLKPGNLAKTEPKQSPTPWNLDEPPPLIKKPTPTPEVSAAEQAKAKVELLDLTSDNDGVLTIKLLTPDPDLPKLLANPIFSPIFGDGSEFNAAEPENAIVSNGAFRLSLITKETVVLDKSQTYRNSAAIDIDTIRFIPTETAEDALDAYRTGRVDAVSNAEFEPVALKLLAPFQDFRKVTHGALNLYEFNTAKAPFSDRDVREALSIAIERERLTEGEMEGATRPALRYLPLGGKPVKELVQDVDHAKDLLSSAGFPNGVGFPVIRLVVNRNDAQQRIAKAVAKMWKQNLGIDTEIIVKETAEIATVKQQGEYDILRRGVVFPSSDAVSNLSAIFNPLDSRPERSLQDFQQSTNSNSFARADKKLEAKDTIQPAAAVPSEAEALYDLKAIPLYFPASYSLVKPYVQGFDPNGLDVLSLKDVRIDYNWQPKRPSNES